VRDFRAFNPYPAIRKVAVVPFINLSNNPAVDGRQVGAAYYAELQKVPGFEVVPIGVVETAIEQHQLSITGASDAQELARLLDVDCVVVGAISDFTPYYPPRIALQIEWYAADPAVAVGPPLPTVEGKLVLASAETPGEPSPLLPEDAQPPSQRDSLPDAKLDPPEIFPGLPPSPPLPVMGPPPLFSYTRLFDGADKRFTRALHDYVELRNDIRFGGEQGYLQRTEDFVRFACHEAIYEMLGQTPGAVETRLVFRRPKRR
jgi:hypothetical protein